MKIINSVVQESLINIFMEVADLIDIDGARVPKSLKKVYD